MTTRRTALVLAAACLFCAGTAASPRADEAGHLVLPAQATSIDLATGMVERSGVTGLCLEKVARAGATTLVVSREPGDDRPRVRLNGTDRDLEASGGSGARLGTIQATRDGALVWLRHFKTGDKQTELLEDGAIRHRWPAGSSVRLLRATGPDYVVLVTPPGGPAQLQTLPRIAAAPDDLSPEVLVAFDGCVPARLRLAGQTVWAQMTCDGGRGSGIYKIALENGTIGDPLIRSGNADFVTLPRSAETRGRIAVAAVSGSEAGLQFYHALKGLLLAQAGEVRACSSDAAGLQSWNQSSRLRALATLYEKTRVQAFAALAVKSMSLTLAARDGASGRSGPTTPACGWSSRIYSANEKARLSLMINQAMIATALDASCDALSDACPAELEGEIGATKSCLAAAFEPDLDPETGLYRIREDIDFRFAGAIAPWNWQLSFAALLQGLPDENMKARADAIATRFRKEVTAAPEGSLWRYWPERHYLEKGLTGADIGTQRFEDTGHAGISLLALAGMPGSIDAELAADITKRTRFLLSFGGETPRDLDGAGPRGPRWYPAGGWADIAPDAMGKAYAGPVPGAQSADALYAYASLFDPAAEFDLNVDLLLCDAVCVPHRRLSYDSWQAFLDNNPFFVLWRSKPPSLRKN